MLIAKVQNGNVLDVADYRSMFPGTSFGSSGPNESFMEENGLMPVSVWVDYDRMTEKLVPAAPYIDGDWVYTVKAEPMTTEEIQQMNDSQAAKVRRQRDQLLLESDWTQLQDAPVDQAAWATYRQELRDVSGQAGFPWTVVWPNKPGYVAPAPAPEVVTPSEPEPSLDFATLMGGNGNDTVSA